MNRWTVGVLGVVTAVLAAALVAQAVYMKGLRRDLEQTRAKVERLETRQKDAPTRAAVEEIQSQISRVEKQAAAPGGARPSADPANPGALPAFVTEDDIQRIVDEKVDQKLQARGDKGNGQWGDRKMPLHDIAKELGLDAVTQAKIAEIADASKKQGFELTKIPRPDGSSLADDVVDAMLSGDSARMQKVFAKIFTEKVPGSDTTYLAAVLALHEEAYQKLQSVMAPEAYQKFRNMGISPDNIQTGYDPWAEYVAQRNNK